MHTTQPNAPSLLARAAPAVRDVLSHIGNDSLANATPCAEFDVTALVDHLARFLETTIRAARKQDLQSVTSPDRNNVDDTLAVLPTLLDQAVAAWSEPGATRGATNLASGEYNADRAAEITVHEVVIHAWDLAKGTGQELSVDEDVAELVLRVSESIEDDHRGRGNAFNPNRPVPDDATTFARAIAATGRDPNWKAGANANS